MASPSLPKGTRDFLPEQVAKRHYLFDTIRETFKRYGFQEIETPSMELSQTLMGKYGEEGDRLIFRVLNNGDFMKDAGEWKTSRELAGKISKRALRYDLTIPFARFVAQHRNEINFPFKRYQIQPVWRADRPQKGRYQEFYQCDADVVGSDSLIHEVEFISIFDEVLSRLGLNEITIKINNRKILFGLAEVAGCRDQLKDVAIVLDKLDKIGERKVKEEWKKRGLSEKSVEVLAEIFSIHGKDGLDRVAGILEASDLGLLGVKELKSVFKDIEVVGLQKARLEFDVTLARGLDYYTGAIFEVTTSDMEIGSIAGGGRYDDLTSSFGLKDMSGVGISFGADRIYDVLEHSDSWPAELKAGTEILFANFGAEEARYCMRLLKGIREEGIAAEIYPKASKMNKQMKYADDSNIPYVALIGSEEMQNGTISLKNLDTGEQRSMDMIELMTLLKQG